MVALIDSILGKGYAGQVYAHEPSAALAQGAVYIVGPYGDHVPGVVLHDLEVYNADNADDIWVGPTLTDVLTAGGNRARVQAGKSRILPGPWAQFVVHLPSTAAGTVVWGFAALNKGQVGTDKIGGHPGHGELVARVTLVQNAAAAHAFHFNRNVTMSAGKFFSAAKNTSAAGTILGKIRDEAGDDLLNTASYDLEGLTNGVLAAATLTATTSRLDIDAGKTATFTGTSNNADMAEGDLAVAIGYTLR